jgi:hypothetical protein
VVIRIAWVTALMMAAPAVAAPPTLKVPEEILAKEQYVRFTPETNAKSVVYVGLSGIDPFPSEELKDSRRFLLNTRGLPEGRYAFAAVAASETGEQVRANFVVVVGTPPKPDPVVPPTPGPSSTLAVAVQKAFEKETSATKAEDVKKLAAVFRQAAEKVTAAPATFTAGEFATLVAKSRTDAIEDRLPGVREPLSSEFIKLNLPDQPNVVLTTEHRAAIKALFTNFATVLEGVR